MQHDFTLSAISKWRSLISLLAPIFFCSCEEEPHRLPEIAGYYQVESLQTELAVDLNNDGLSSTNAMAEISQANYISQYNFNAPDTYLEIRPTKYQTTRIQYLYVPFPDPRVTFEYTDSPNGQVSYLRNGLNGIGYRYEYDEKNKLIHLDLTQVKEGNEQQWGKLVDIKVLNQDRLQLLVSKNYYDFSQAGWIRLQLTGIYKKVSH